MKFLMRTAVAAAAIASIPLAADATVYIGLQQAGTNGGALTTIASSATGSTSYSGSYGTYAVNSITATGQPLDVNLLDSTALNLATSSAGQINVYVSSTGNTEAGAVDLLSSLTSNLLPPGWTATLRTFWDPSNAAFGTANPIGSNTFSTIGTDIDHMAATLPGAFSVTGIYTMVSDRAGTALSTLHAEATAVREPGSAAILASALGLFGIVGWRCRKPRHAAA